MTDAFGLMYDASSLLRFGRPIQGFAPQIVAGEIVIWYGGWNLEQLLDNEVVQSKGIIADRQLRTEFDWSTEMLPIGFYRLRIPVPHSNVNTFDEQLELLSDTESVAHPILVATAELCHFISTNVQLLKGIYVRTSKKDRFGQHVVVCWHNDRLCVGDGWRDSSSGNSTYIATVHK